VVEEANKALDDGHCVVIGLQATGEAALDYAELTAAGEMDDFVSHTRESVRKYIEKFFPDVCCVMLCCVGRAGQDCAIGQQQAHARDTGGQYTPLLNFLTDQSICIQPLIGPNPSASLSLTR
jgi:hypothetical protein